MQVRRTMIEERRKEITGSEVATDGRAQWLDHPTLLCLL